MSTFAQPLWLLTGLTACCGAVLLILLSSVRRKKELEKIAAPHLLPLLTANVSPFRQRLKNSLFVLGLACLFVALARPQHGQCWVEVRRKGIDILIGVDVSKSMLTPDIKPNRLARAKLAVRDFAAKLDGDRIGLLPFAGTAFLMCPLTADYDAFNASLDSLDTSSVPAGGTDIGAAIAQAGKTLSTEADHKIFVIITDGEDLGATALKEAEAAKQDKMTIFTVGVGTPQGELVPLPDGQAGSFVKDEQGKFVTSKLDEKTLTGIAEATGGLYVPLGSTGQGFETIYERKLAMIPKEEREQRRRKMPIECFPWPIAVAIVLLSAEFFMSERRGSGSLHLPSIITAGRRKLKQTAAAGLLVVLCLAPARADEGGELFRAGKYEQAAQFYQEALRKDGVNPALHFNLGACLHKQQKYEQAAEEFGKALATDDLSLQAKSYYNQGNSKYALGAAAPEQAMEQWRQAKQSFEAALKLDPKNKATARNLELVSKKLAELEKKQKEQAQQSNSGTEKDSSQQDVGEEERKESGRRQEQTGEKQKSGAEDEKKNAAPQEKSQTGEQEKAEVQQESMTGTQNNGQDAARREEAERKRLGKMTEEEAKILLNSLQDEQGALNFIPQEAPGEEEVRRDW